MDTKTIPIDTQEDRRRNWSVPLNGEVYQSDDPVLTGRDLLGLGGLAPASEFILVMVKSRRTRLIGLDDKIDLREVGGAVFRAALGDRAFTFTLDEVGEVWCAETIEVDDFLTLFHVPEGHDLVLERVDQPDVVLRPGGSLSFAPRGAEHLITRPGTRPDQVLVTVFATAGVFPAEGALRVPASALVQTVLQLAAEALHIADTAGWVVSIDGRSIDPAQSFADNGLAGAVELDWSAPEGGGGYA
ncbi:multiubiquitin domain-containing protein [Caulobacter sp.]|uniref:multiubiquitin domain-containing protein n=1 Tax=Caulobacter sp. TaxID=78 RepID=UPI003BA956C2